MTIKDAANIMKNLFIELTIENDVLTDEEKDAFVFVANILVEQDKKLYEDAISRAEAIRIASGYCHWSNIPAELAKLPSVNPKPCEDAISRQAVLELAKWDGRDGLGSIIHAFDVERLPSVTPAPKMGRWIPVSERLPEDHDWYVIVVKEKSTGYQYIPRIASHNHDNCWSIIDTEDADKEWLDDLECIAWMPLPAPYKEVEE